MDGLEDALRHLRVSQSTVVAIDTEGTTRTGGIREIAAVVLGSDDGAAFYEIVTRQSQNAAPLDARRTWATVGVRFWAWLASVAPAGDVVCVMHNGACHDVPLIERDTRLHCPAAPTSAFGTPRLRVVDSLELVRKHLVDVKKRDLASVYEALFGAPPAKRHTALADARALASILLHERVYAHIIPSSAVWAPAGGTKNYLSKRA